MYMNVHSDQTSEIYKIVMSRMVHVSSACVDTCMETWLSSLILVLLLLSVPEATYYGDIPYSG